MLPDWFILFSLKGVFSFSCFPFPGVWLGVVFHRSGILPAISWPSSIPLRWRCPWFLAFSRCSLVSHWASSTTCECFVWVFSWWGEWNVFGCRVCVGLRCPSALTSWWEVQCSCLWLCVELCLSGSSCAPGPAVVELLSPCTVQRLLLKAFALILTKCNINFLFFFSSM